MCKLTIHYICNFTHTLQCSLQKVFDKHVNIVLDCQRNRVFHVNNYSFGMNSALKKM